MRNILVFLVFVSMFFVQGRTRLLSEDLSVRPPEKNYGFSVTPRLGFLWGRGEEVVYGPPNDSNYLSQLLWDFKPLFFAGADLEFDPRSPAFNKGFVTGLSFKFGLPLYRGIMEDRDWMADGASYVTHYSRHDIFSDGRGLANFIAGISFGYSWAMPKESWVKVYGEASFSHFSWAARDGYKQYGLYDSVYRYKPSESGTPVPTAGPVVSYTQNWIILAPGFAFGVRLSENFALSFAVSLSPFNYGFCRDDHLDPDKDTTYLDFPVLGMSIREEIAFCFTVNKKIELGISTAVRHLGGARGDGYSSSSGDSYTYDGAIAGGGYLFLELSLSGKYVF